MHLLTLADTKRSIHAQIHVAFSGIVRRLVVTRPLRQPHVGADREALEHHVEDDGGDRERPSNGLEVVLVHIPLDTSSFRLLGFDELLVGGSIKLRFLTFY